MTILDSGNSAADNANDLANDIYGEAASLVDKAMTRASSTVGVRTPSLDFFVPGESIPKDVPDVDVGGHHQQQQQLRDFSDDFDLADIYIPPMPSFGSAPVPIDTSTLFKVDKPVFNIPDFEETSPDVDIGEDTPNAPTIVLPDAPESTDSLVAPDLVAPTFDKEFGGSALAVSDDLSGDYDADYSQMLPEMRDSIESFTDAWLAKHNPEFFDAQALLESKIESGLNGGGAITDAVEDQMFSRVRNRAVREKNAIETQITDSHSKRGFHTPPGVVVGGLAKAQMETSRNVSVGAAEVAIERAKIEVQHFQFLMQVSTSIRIGMIQSSLQHFGNLVSVNGQALEHARQVGIFIAESFNEQLQVHDSEMKLYGLEATVYQTKLEAAFAELKVFEAQVAAEKLKADVDRNQIAIYESKINAERSKIQIYVAELEGIRSLADVERLKVQVFESQVRAYATRIQAKTAEYGAYTAAIGGDEALVRAYGEQVRAYGLETDATRTQVVAAKTRNDSILDSNRLLVDIYNSELKKFELSVRSEDSRFAATVAGKQLLLQRFAEQTKAYVSDANAAFEESKQELQGAMQYHEGQVRTYIADANLHQKGIELSARSALAGADVLKGLGSAAANAATTIYNLASEE